MIKFTKPIIAASSILTVFITTALYSIFVPLINNGGECRISTYSYSEICDSILGFHIPYWWRVGAEASIPISILFGLFCGLSLFLYFLIKAQKETND
jgi:hypothetical protein